MHRWLTGCLWILLAFSNTFLPAQDSDAPPDESPGVDAGLLGAFSFRNLGPALMSGRIGDIVVDPVDRSTWYVAASSGGVWKTTNAGVTWQPIFDGHGSYSIGCLALDPNDRFTLWVGTGENNGQRSVGYGDGLYKSTDGGQSFTRMGLETSEHIGRIVIHPEDSQTVYVAAQGPLWKEGGERGLYRTTDGGRTWQAILQVSENTGINEVHLDPSNPSILYASAWQRRRHTWVLINGGPESGIFKSTDGGETWNRSQRGLPGGDLGRIGIAVSPVNPEIVYAIVEAAGDQSGFYRSTNRGETWQRMSNTTTTSPQYYNEIVACPHSVDRVYLLDTYNMVSEDGGRTFSQLGEAAKHVDNHALVVDPADPEHLICGCDGGVYESWDRGRNWDYKANLPITQFYRVAVSNDLPFYNVYGGTQDNATQGGPSRTTNVHGIRNSDWFITVFGDGFEPAVDPKDPNTVYSQYQHGGLVRFDRVTGEAVDIKPQESAEGPPLRWNWDSALIISPHNHRRLYFGSQILFRSNDRGDSWEAVSGDLTRQIDRNQLKVMGRVWGVDTIAKNASTSLYGNIVSLSESPLQENLLYVGTDDGLLQITTDGGQNWTAVSRFGTLDVPEFGYINDIEADLFDPQTVYVAVNNHKRGDFRPYLVKSVDGGKSWSDITGNLPQRGSVYTIAQDHVNPLLLFCGTEFGCYCTLDGGNKWIRLGSGLPTIAIRDMEIQRRENDLVLASFGRGFFVMDDYSALREINPELLAKDHIFPVRKGLIYQPANPLGVDGPGFQGANFYAAPNPEYGVSFTVHCKDAVRSRKSEREEKDRKLAASKADSPYPSWEDLKAEDREVAPTRWLTIRNQSQEVVRRIPVGTGKGIQRVNWDLNHAGAGRRGSGPAAVPGQYTVALSQMIDGAVSELVPPTTFEIEPLNFNQLEPVDREAVLVFSREVNRLSQAVSAAMQLADDASRHLTAVEALTRTAAEVDPALWRDIRDLQLELLDLQEKFTGDPTRPQRNEAALPGIQGRLMNAMFGAMGSSAGPTQTHRRQFEIAGQEYLAVVGNLKQLLDRKLPALLKKMDAVGAPWTPGRPLPDWKPGDR